MNNPITWWELATHDQEKSVHFFENVFGWEFKFDDKAGFYKLKNGASTLAGGGIFTLQRAKLPFVALYIEVDDIHEKARLVQENGGFIVDAPFEIGPGAWLCLFNEPSGVTFAMISEQKEQG